MSDRLFEGIGAPVSIDQDVNAPSIDPTLDSCCQREVRYSEHPALHVVLTRSRIIYLASLFSHIH